MTNADDHFDCRQLSFPSDKLSIKDLRRLFPHEFDDPPSVTFFFETGRPGTLADLLHAERCIAEYAFGHGDRVGLTPLEKGTTYAEKTSKAGEEEKRLYTQDLVRLYQKYGLASGPETAQELVRSIETSAAPLAAHSGQKSK